MSRDSRRGVRGSQLVVATRRHGRWLSALLIAVLAYVPSLLSSPGRMPADTKLYLYLDPGQLISDAPWSFDARQFGGHVPHQMISYLWPQGPWYWFWDTLEVPDWVAQRLWIGTLMFLAGAGILWASRRLGLGVAASLAAALVYQLSPYLLPYVSRTSAMLLAWAGLGWIVGCATGAATRTKWRDAAIIALIVATVGAPNPTALAMIAPAPLLYLLCAALQRQITPRRAFAAAARIGVLSLGVSLWWIVMVSIQNRRGADVLAYSESLDAVSYTSTSPEVWRGLGYWLSYVRDPYAATTTATRDYLVSGRIIATGFAIVVLGLLGLALTRWAHRLFAAALVTTGVVLGVGVHPIDDPSALMDALVGDGESGAALALRSSTRAVPLLVLGLGLGVGALVDGLGSWWAARSPDRAGQGGGTILRLALTLIVAVLSISYLPSLTDAAFVDPALERDQDPPAAWLEAAAALDEGSDRYRVIQLPGAEFGAFRWGYTVDPPLPGLTDRSMLTRDLLPLGSAGAMDLLYALDQRFQDGTIEPRSIAPVARLLGADTIWVTNDAAFDRFRTPRPELTHELFSGDDVPGLGEPVPYGRRTVNVPDVPMVDETSLSNPLVGEPIPAVELVPVEDPRPIVSAGTDVVVLAGSGDGVVDAAAAGMIDGHEVLRYAGSIDRRELADAIGASSLVVVTDSNRDRAHHWRSSQDVSGFTERGGEGGDVLRPDTGDERLPVFDVEDALAQTVTEQRGPVVATASAYGEPFAYQPEHRPVMAIDGDPSTSWVVGDRSEAVGELIRLEVAEPFDVLSLRQPDGAAENRHIVAVAIRVGGRDPVAVALDDRSLTGTGQPVELPPTDGPSTVDITITATESPDPNPGPARAAVGFAEIDLGLEPTVEVTRLPTTATDELAQLADAPGGERPPLAIVMSRLRTRADDRWRADPEPTMTREFDVPERGTMDPTVTVRLDQRAGDATLVELLGIEGAVATDRLVGATSAAGWSATDGDRATSWITPFAGAVGARLNVPVPSGPIRLLRIVQPPGDFSPITELRVRAGSRSFDVAVPPPAADGTSQVRLPRAIEARRLTLQITAVDARTTIDRRWAEPVELPAAIAEVTPARRTSVPATLRTGCRVLLTVGRAPLRFSIEAATADLLAGAAVDAELCGGDAVRVAEGTVLLETGDVAGTGLQVDRVVLAEPRAITAATSPRRPTPVRIDDSSRTMRSLTVGACPEGCWLALGEGFNEAWSASTPDGGLGAPQLVDGGFNGWWLPPSEEQTSVEARWTAQRPLTIALVLSGVFVLASIALVVAGRVKENASLEQLEQLERPIVAGAGRRETRTSLVVAALVWVGATLLLVEPGWVLPAAIGAGLLVRLGRSRLASVVAIAGVIVIGVVMVRVVQDERPFPDAGWPVRFEWLHGLGWFAAVSVVVGAIGRAAPRTQLPAPSPDDVVAAPASSPPALAPAEPLPSGEAAAP